MTASEDRRPPAAGPSQVHAGRLLLTLLVLPIVGVMLARATMVALPDMAEGLGADYSVIEWVLAAN